MHAIINFWVFLSCFQLHEDDISVVGVHVRRGDKLHALYQDTQHGYRIPDPSHILYAMDYLRYKHNHKVIFVISSDDKVMQFN